MADADKAEKLAAARKRFEQLKKAKEKGKKGDDKKKAEEPPPAPESAAGSQEEESSTAPGPSTTIEDGEAKERSADIPQETDTVPEEFGTPTKPSHTRQQSLSLQSRLRSTSFRQTSNSQDPLSPIPNGSKSPNNLAPLSPDGDAVTEIYRKQAFRIDELEKENKRLAKEAREAEARWRRTEEELEELREANSHVAELKSRANLADAKTEEVNKLKTEITSLQRQISQLQALTNKTPRQSSVSHTSPSPDLQAQLDSKSSTIESMEMEISNLRAQLDRRSSSSSSHKEQVAALEEKLDRAERAAGAAQRELLDARKNLERASEKALKEGTERTSAETKIRNLARETEESKRSAEESMKRVETLEKKLSTLSTLHKESDARRQIGERERERIDKDIAELRRKMAGAENENLRLREERERLRMREASGGVDNEGLDELEDEERQKLERKVRELEGEVFELRRGVWKDKKRELGGVSEEGNTFDDVDLSGPTFPPRRPSMKGARPQGDFVGALMGGFSAFTGGSSTANTFVGGRRASLAPTADLDDDFDEDAFRAAQEEEGRKRIERVKEVKRGLKDWEGWRMDIVDSRIGGGGAGEIFDI
ncbi:MAG: hypothetical protein MMC33_001622 [Icmadophila ericetorum]|nr:hypothetical protein [Icmadophila ericetorum]